jgi:hypothetical protein
MAIAATDWVAVSIPAALETSVTASTVVAFTAVPVAVAIAVSIANDDDHPCDGHDVDDCLPDGHDNVIVDNGLTLSCSLSVVYPVESGN